MLYDRCGCREEPTEVERTAVRGGRPNIRMKLTKREAFAGNGERPVGIIESRFALIRVFGGRLGEPEVKA